jgi:hypothetical protein
VLSWLAFILSDRPIGCSTAFSRTSGMIERSLRRPKVMSKPYYRRVIPAGNWQWMLVLSAYFLISLGWVRLDPKPGSLGNSVVEGLVLGAGFAVLGYCPGILAGAIARALSMSCLVEWWGF